MTTIAYKDGVIAYDSRVTTDDLIRSDSASKSRTVKGVHFFLAGYVCDEDKFIEMYFNREVKHSKLESSAIVYDHGNLFIVGTDDDTLFSMPLEQGEVYAIGSGTPHAYTAMDMGASAKEAVEMASKRDTSTGGHINYFELPKAGIESNG